MLQHQLFAAAAERLMMSIWRTFYIDQGRSGFHEAPSLRGTRVSLAFFCRRITRATRFEACRPRARLWCRMTYFGNVYKDDRATNSFAQVVTTRTNIPRLQPTRCVPPISCWPGNHDRTGPW